MPDELPPEEEPGGMVEDGVSVLVAPPVLLPLVPLVPLVLPVSDGMPLELPDEVPVPLGELPPELPLGLEPEPPPVMPVQAPSSMAQAMGNIHLVIKHSR